MKLNSIQFLRAVAALLVVYEHSLNYQAKFKDSNEQTFLHLNHFGCIGVDLFFVISGFIITHVANNYTGQTQAFHFLWRRFCRINPTYYIASFLSLAVYIIWLKVYQQPELASLTKIGSQVSDSIFILPITGAIESFSPLLIVGWTLAFEWLFYVIFFSLIALKAKRKLLLLIGFIGCLIIIGRLSNFEDLRLNLLTNPIMLEFLLGVIICHAFINIKSIPAYIGYILLIIGLISYALMISYGFGLIWDYQATLSGSQSLNRVFYWGIPSSFVFAGSVILEKERKLIRLWSNRFSIIAGNASYSIYLVHTSVFILLMGIHYKIEVFLPPDAIVWVQIIIALSLSLVFYKFVEKPLLKYMNQIDIWNFLFHRERNTKKKQYHRIASTSVSRILTKDSKEIGSERANEG